VLIEATGRGVALEGPEVDDVQPVRHMPFTNDSEQGRANTAPLKRWRDVQMIDPARCPHREAADVLAFSLSRRHYCLLAFRGGGEER